MARMRVSRRRLANEPNRMRHHPRLLAQRALPTLQEARLHRHLRHPHSDLLPDEHSRRSQLLQLLPLLCRNLPVVVRHLATSARRQTINLLPSLGDTRRISAHRNHHRSRLHITLSITLMSTSDNSHHILHSRVVSTATISHTLILNHHRLHLISLLLLQRSKTPDNSNHRQI